MDIQHTLRQCATAIGQAFVREGLSVHIFGATQGPHTLTFCVGLHEATQTRITRALGMGDALAAALGMSPVRIYTADGRIYIEAPSPVPAVVAAPNLVGRGLAVPLGVDAHQQVRGLSLADSPHLVVVGPTQTGKTTAMREIAYQLCRQNLPHRLQILIASVKPAAGDFGAVAQASDLAASADESAEMLVWLRGLMTRRVTINQQLPRYVAFVDDILNLLDQRPDLVESLRAIVSLGRAAGIHLVLGTQSLSRAGIGDAVITRNLTTRLVFKAPSAADAVLATGRSGTGAEQLSGQRGDALLITEAATVRLAVGYLRPGDIALAIGAQQLAGRQLPRPGLWLTIPAKTASPPAPPVVPVAHALVLAAQPPHASTTTGTTGGELPDVTSSLRQPRRRGAVTAAERLAVWQIYQAQGRKINRTIAAIWGSKDPAALGWLHDVIRTQTVSSPATAA